MKKVRYDCRPTERYVLNKLAPKGPKSKVPMGGAGRVQPDNRQQEKKKI